MGKSVTNHDSDYESVRQLQRPVIPEESNERFPKCLLIKKRKMSTEQCDWTRIKKNSRTLRNMG
jgi:hypothetical protein